MPERSTCIAAPDQVHIEGLAAVHDNIQHILHVTINQQQVTFSFREDHILVFSEQPFDAQEFRQNLKNAATWQRASTKVVPQRFQERVSELAQ